LLKEAGYQVEGVFMKNWEDDDTDTYCPASVDMVDAQAVCDKLHIELHRVNFAAEYWQQVFVHFLEEYRAGRTPNPDILCNQEIKFKAFLHYAKQRGADAIATGHYARVVQSSPNEGKNEQFHLLKGLDPLKDQSYFLHTLTQHQLSHSIFPVGELDKSVVRDIAKKLGFSNHAKKDSTGICFIGERKFKAFLSEYLRASAGVIKTESGEVLGQHDGLMFYTIGQRQGLKIGGRKHSTGQPWYVVAKNTVENTLIVAEGQNHPSLYADALAVSDVHWISDAVAEYSFPLRTHAKIRYRQEDQPCMIHYCCHGSTSDQGRPCYYVVFDQPQRAITPGQSVVFYQDDRCLGGGIIVSQKNFALKTAKFS
jgi:tRNA-specific 2-thiouridylase